MVSASPLASDPEPNQTPSGSSPLLLEKKLAKRGIREKFSASNAESLASATDAWLDWQCKLISGVQQAAVFQTRGSSVVSVQACFPRNKKSGLSMRSTLLREFAVQALTSDEAVAFQQKVHDHQAASADVGANAGGEKTICDFIALKVPVAGNDCIVALQVSARSKPQLGAVVRLLQWGGHWLSSLNEHLEPEEDSAADLLQSVMTAESVSAACISIVNDVCKRFACDKVSIGIVEGFTVRLVAISQLADFDRRQQLVQMIEATIDESIDQQSILSLPAIKKNKQNLLPAHRQLQSQQPDQALATIPLDVADTTIGGVLLTRAIAKPFATDELDHCREYIAKVAPALDLLCKSQEGLFQRLKRQSGVLVNQFLQPGSLQQRWKTIAASAALIAVLFFPVTHHVSALANIEGADKQLLVSPQSGYINSAHFRAGDQVAKGDVIATLDDRDLLMDRDKWKSELAKVNTSFSQALGSRNRAEIALLQAQKQQVTAELTLVEQQLSRSILTAPFDGVLVSGDLNQSLGAPVETGQVLFELASLEDFRLILSVSESDVASVKPGQESKLRLSALPGQTYSASIENLMPISISENGENVFRLEATLAEVDKQLRPGMHGVAKIATERDPLIWVLIHPLIEKLSLWFWAVL